MSALWTTIAVLLGVAALLGTARLMLGPSILDRALSVDVLMASSLTGIGAYAAFNRDPSVLPILLVLSLVGFVSSIAISMFVVRRHLDEHPGAAGPRGGDAEGRTP